MTCRLLLAAVLMSACGGVPAAASSHRFTEASVLPPGGSSSPAGRNFESVGVIPSSGDIRTTTTARASRGRVSTITTGSNRSTVVPDQALHGDESLGAFSAVNGAGATVAPPQIGTALQVARASWYGEGTRTASGARFEADGRTFAHRTMPFGTKVKFCVGATCVVAVCTDRGPYVPGREFDLSRGAFKSLAPLSSGVVIVEWEIIQ